MFAHQLAEEPGQIHHLLHAVRPDRKALFRSPFPAHPGGMPLVPHYGSVTETICPLVAAFLEFGASQLPAARGILCEDPPAWDGRKVSLLDTDHIWGVGGSAAWVWRSFVRGHNPIFMDPYDGSVLGVPSDPRWEPIRLALGHSRRLAERLNLAGMQPRPDFASTGYCLANPGLEYLVYQPKPGETFSVEMKPGRYRYEWINPATAMAAGSGSTASAARSTTRHKRFARRMAAGRRRSRRRRET